jgi:signal transduction histidine kinase/DNA-binding response OmpR family regulator/HAMP domain-containing protein
MSKYLTLRSRIILAAVIPLLILLYYLQLDLSVELKNKDAANKVIKDVEYIDLYSRVLHEIQRERARAVRYMTSVNSLNREALTNQRDNSNIAIQQLLKSTNKDGGERRKFPLLDSLSITRSKINNIKNLHEVSEEYRAIKKSLFNEIIEIVKSTDIPEIKNAFDEHFLLLNLKDNVAVMRSALTRAMGETGSKGENYRELVITNGYYENNLEMIQQLAQPELKNYFDKLFRGEDIVESFKVINAFKENPNVEFRNLDFDKWWDVTTAVIHTLNDVENYSMGLIKGRAAEYKDNSNASVIRNILIASLTVLLISLFAGVTIYDINRSLSSVKEAAIKVSKGETDIVLDTSRKDEVGEMFGAFNRMVSVTREYSDAADRMGKGDYSPLINIRGEADLLGAALNNMRDNLKVLSEQNKIRTWLLTSGGEVNNALRGEKEPTQLADSVLKILNQKIKGYVALLYLREENDLLLVGSYAAEKDAVRKFAMGEGLVGQVAINKKITIYNDIPEDYIRITSGTGSSEPKHLLLFPFLYEGETSGVIEIASTVPFSYSEIELLEMMGENIGIAFHSALNRKRLRDLLEETQIQAEELETRQEELRQSNEQLMEKTILLEKNEAELKAQQEELQMINEELIEKARNMEEQKQVIEDAKQEIEEKAAQLEITSHYKSQFLANMSHELRTPLNSILILAQLLADDSEGVDEKNRVFAKNIYNAGNDLLLLINDILDLSKIESGKMELEINPVSFNEIAAGMKSTFFTIASEKGINFTITVPEQAHNKIITDRQRLEQILKNLLSNAFKFTDSGGRVDLAIYVAAKGLLFNNRHLNSAPGVVAFTITDSGIGIPKGKLNAIFEAFTQADGSTKRKYGGTGLGLSISRELAGALGGEIQVESSEKKGSRFTLYLPFEFNPNYVSGTDKKVEIINLLPKPSSGSGAVVSSLKQKLLIIEDDAVHNTAIQNLFKSKEKGVEYLAAYSGQEALSILNENEIDCIISDLNLPDFSGFELLERLNKNERWRKIPVVIYTGRELDREENNLLQQYTKSIVIKTAASHDRLVDEASYILSKALYPSDADDDLVLYRRDDILKDKKILIVDDDKRNIFSLESALNAEGMETFIAEDGNEALRVLEENSDIEIVLMDIMMPEMDGYEATKRIRKITSGKNLPIIALTAKAMAGDLEKCIEAGMSDYISKPVNLERLKSLLKVWLSR